MLTAFMVLLLLALCGFIAYIGDLLGRRLGKKRLSLFGLRPKHTAIVLTIVTGVLIAGVTFGFALLVVPGFREVVTKGERLARENAGLAQQNRERREENEQLTERNGQLVLKNRSVARENRDLSGRNTELNTRNENLLTQSKRLEGAIAGLKAQNATLTGTNTRLVQDRSRLQLASNKLEQQQRLLKEQNRLYQHEQKLYQQGAYLFRRDEEIIPAQVLPPGAPRREDIRRVLNALVDRAENAVRNNPRRDAKQPFVLSPPSGYTGTSSKQEDIIAWVAERAFHQRSQPQVLQVLATVNVPQDRPVYARLRWTPNKQVLSKGQELARAEVDGTGTDAYILTELLTLQDRVRDELTRKDVRLGSNSSRPSPEMLAATLELARRLKELNRPMVVIARAREDTHRMGPAYVDLDAVPMAAASR